MEKKKSKVSKIVLQYEQIIEEKTNVQENLDLLFNKVISSVEYVKQNHDNMKPKDVTDVHKYCLDVLKQLTEVNSVLENLFELDPVSTLIPKENICKQSEYQTPSFKIKESQEASSEIVQKAEEPFALENLSFGSLDKDFADIESLKKSVQQLGEKLGINKSNLSDIQNYYQKPTSSNSLREPADLVTLSDNFEIPEKDTNTSQDLIVIEEIQNPNISKPLDPFNEEYTDMSGTDFKIALVKNKEDPTTSLPVFSTKVSNKDNLAIHKLNNYRKPEEENIESAIIPEISLKPSGSVIQNYENKSKSDSKQKKKRPKSQCNFELRKKEMPEVGQTCVISHIENPSEFYIHIVDDATEKIDQMKAEINEFMKSKYPLKLNSKEDAFAELGKYCIVCIDNNWFRAKILDGYLNEKHNQVLVQLVDYGNKKLVSYKELRRLTDFMCELPMLAVRCHFPLCYPPNSTHNKKLTEWPTSSVESFLDIAQLKEEDVEIFKIAYIQEQGNSYAIDLCFFDSEDTVGDLLLELGLAVQIINDAHHDEEEELNEYFDNLDTSEPDNINEVILGYNPRDEARICRFTKPDGTCFKGKNCKLDHVPFSRGGFTTDKDKVYFEAMDSLRLQPLGSTITILITQYIDICRFFAQIINVPCVVKDFMMDRDFYSLLEVMNSPNCKKTFECFKIMPAKGEVVMVKVWEKWSRGIVREIYKGVDFATTEAQIFLVDVGDYLKVKVKELRKIKPDFLKLPFQAVECHIYNYEMNKDYPKEHAKDFFEKNMYFKNFSGVTKSSSLPLKLHLKNINGLIDVGETLALNKLAVKKQNDICHISENSILYFD